MYRGNYHIEHGLGKVAIQLSQTIRELGHIDCDQLIGVLYSVVQSRYTIKGQVGKVFIVDKLCKPCSVLERQLGLVIR